MNSFFFFVFFRTLKMKRYWKIDWKEKHSLPKNTWKSISIWSIQSFIFWLDFNVEILDNNSSEERMLRTLYFKCILQEQNICRRAKKEKKRKSRLMTQRIPFSCFCLLMSFSDQRKLRSWMFHVIEKKVPFLL